MILNAAGALYVSGDERDYEGAVRQARAALSDGAGLEALQRLRAATQREAKPK